MTADPETHVEPTDEAWREIDALVDQIAGLSRADLPPRDFYQGLLERIVRALAAVGGAVWLAEQPGRLTLEHQIQLDALDLDDPEHQHAHHRLVALAVSGGTQTRTYPPRGSVTESGETRNPTDYLLFVCPLVLDQQVVGALEVVQRPTIHPAAYRGNERLLGLVAELALEYTRERQRRGYQQQLEFGQQLDQFARRVHSALDPRQAAYEIANEGRRLIGCDRLSVAVVWGARSRIMAVSGVDLFDPRANVVRRLERLVRRVLATGEPLWHMGDWQRVPPQLEEDLHQYLDESHGRTLAVVPLYPADPEPGGREQEARELGARGLGARGLGGFARDSTEPVGALVIERFDAELDDPLRARVTAVARHSAVALRNAAEYRSLPLLPVSRGIRRVLGQFQGHRLRHGLLGGAGLGLLAVVLWLVPAGFRVPARGQLQPQQSRHVYAPEDGEVAQLLVHQHQDVKQGQPLLRLVSMELALERERAETERITTNKQLESIGIQRVTGDIRLDDPEVRAEQLSAQELEFAQLLRAQEKQIEIIQRRQQDLEVSSPIAGRLLTWDLERLLQDRPVRKGELLMRVADMDGPWVAELEVPDHEIGHVLAAQAAQGPELAVSLILGTDPGVSYQGRVLDVARTATLDQEGRPVVMVRVRVDEPIDERYPGATVHARIACGRRSLGYVWLHDLIDVVRTRLLF